MKRLLALFLVLVMLVSATSILAACQKADDNTPVVEQPTPDPEPTPDPDPTPTPTPEPQEPTIIVPEYKDYGRDTVNYSELVYESVDIEQLIADFEAVTAAIKTNEIPVEDQIALIISLEDGYLKYSTMYTLASINNSHDSSNQYWLDEYTYLATGSASFSKAVEDMYVACAQSVHKETFESEYFGSSLDEYVDGGVYTDELVALLAEEADLIAQYNGFSTTSVIITADGKTGTVEELLSTVSPVQYEAKRAYYMTIYMQVVTNLTKTLYIDLIKVRLAIADAFGAESYAEIGYADRGHDYDPEQTMKFFGDVADVLAISSVLYDSKFSHIYTEREPSANTVTVMNSLYDLFGEMDSELQDIYAYMLQHGLYDIAPSTENRSEGAYTTYIEGNNSPFIFMTASNKCGDYVTVAHEFGHFADMYINNGLGGSLDLSEVYSQALSYLMIVNIKDKLSDTIKNQKLYRYMLHYELAMIENVLTYQGYLAVFEHMVYELSPDEVTEEKLQEIMTAAQMHCFGFPYDSWSVWDAVLIPHTIEYPFYVQSYATSLVAAIEIMLMEIEEPGSGIAAYKLLLARDDENPLTFEEELARAGIASPLRDGALDSMYRRIYAYVMEREYPG